MLDLIALHHALLGDDFTAQDVLEAVDEAEERGELPDVSEALADRPDDNDYRALVSALQGQLDRAVTDAFSRPFLLAAAIALAALVPLGLSRGQRL